MRRKIGCWILAAAVLCLSGCTGSGPSSSAAPASSVESVSRAADSSSEESGAQPQGKPADKTESSAPDPAQETRPAGGYTAPEMATSAFHADLAEEGSGARIDTSALSEGYVAASASSSERLKFQVVKGDVTYNYNLSSDGAPSVFPLQSGDGDYLFRVMENVGGTSYAEMFSTTAGVSLSDEFQPFLRPSDYVSYDEGSACVAKARELAAQAEDQVGVVSQVFDFVCATVRYDWEKAETVAKGYLPDPDETLRTGQGICFDYASLAAAMLRSQGIPTKVIFGYVSPNDVYHAWNMFYTQETGWVTVDYRVDQNSWNRLDLTFSANGADGTFIGDGGNYADVYLY